MLDRFTGYKRLLALAALNGGGASIIERTAIGNPLTFLTDLARPLKSLLIPFTPQQEGTGDPSPENIRSILPWNGLKVWNGGKNLFDKTNGTEGFVWWEGQLAVGYNDFFASNKIPVVPGAKYTLKKDVTGQNQCELFDINGNFVSQSTNMMGLSVSTFIIPDGVYFIAFNINKTALDTAQLEVGSTPTAYEPYHPITDTDIVFPSPIYGGTLDVVSGVLMNEWIALVFDGSSDEAWGDNGSNGYYIPAPVGASNEWIKLQSNYLKGLEPGEGRFLTDWTCRLNLNVTNLLVKPDMTNISSVSAWKAYLAENPLTIICPLATPQEITLTPEQITALVGDNTIWSDADGSMTAVYLLTESFGDDHPISGGLGSGLLGGGFGSGSGEPDEPDEPGDPDEPGEPDQPDEPAEPDQPGEE